MSEKKFEAALEEYKGDVREAYNFGFDEETNAVNLALKAARWARAFTLGELRETSEARDYPIASLEAWKLEANRLRADIERCQADVEHAQKIAFDRKNQWRKALDERDEARAEVERLRHANETKSGYRRDMLIIDALKAEVAELKELLRVQANVTTEYVDRAARAKALAEALREISNLKRYSHDVREHVAIKTATEALAAYEKEVGE